MAKSRVSLAILGDEKSSTIFGSILRLPQPDAITARYFSIENFDFLKSKKKNIVIERITPQARNSDKSE